MKSGAHLRRAQVAALEGKRADVRAASDDHRRALADAVRRGEQIASESGSTPDRDALTRTLEALSLRSGDDTEPPGRLTRPLQPAGFEALGGLRLGAGGRPTLVPVRAHKPPEPPSRPAAALTPAQRRKEEADRKRLEAVRRREEAAAKKRAAAEQRKAAAAERKRQAAVREAEAAVERARRQMAEAELKLRAARGGT
jgi:hypothetical protein